jgi:hypothetical protein
VPTRIRLTFTTENVSAVADLLEDQAPNTRAAVVRVLPLSGETHQAPYYGSETMLILEAEESSVR